MPIHGYAGGVISATPVVPTSTSASGVWTTELQAQALAAGNWPNASSQIARSLRFNSADSAYLNRTPASAGNRKTWTLSFWIKRSFFNADNQHVFGATSDAYASNYALLTFLGGPDERLRFTSGGHSPNYELITTQVFRDISAWYHFVIAFDTTQATASNRIKFYVNGSQITAFASATYPTQNLDSFVNNNIEHTFGTTNRSPNGYLADAYLIDGQALTPSSFGYTDPNTGVWVPNAYNGSYGTNGFHLNFYNNTGTTSTTLGLDTSGNGNNWTPNNFSVTAGAGNDSLVDTPTPYGTDTGAGGEVRGNYATWSPITGTSNVTLSNGNLDASTANTCHTVSTIGMTTGLWYWEITQIANGGNAGIYRFDAPVTNRFPNVANQAYVYNGNGYVYDGQANPVGSQYSTYTTNDVISFAFDATNGKLYVAKNGTWQNSGNPAAGTGAVVTGITTSSLWFAGVADGGGSTTSWTANFGQRPFAYTAPSGFKALCTTNLPAPAIGATASTRADDYFNTVLYTGNGSTQSITGVGFQPDFVWLKSRRDVYGHQLFDAVRGATKRLSSNVTDAEVTNANSLTAFNSDGFSVGTDAGINTSTNTMASWNWKANGSGSTNTAGSITSTVSANTTSGFSIVTYTGNATAGATVGHGLGVAPKMIIVKRRDASSNWAVGHTSIGWTNGLILNDTSASASQSTWWNDTAPTSTVFSLGTAVTTNTQFNPLVAYCFSEVAGYSRFGSYTGNGSNDGPMIFTGFRPAYVMIKRSSSSGTNWQVLDTKRSTYNLTADALYASASVAEFYDATVGIDCLSNGFKIRGSDGNVNSSGATYIYAAFAEFPFKYTLAR